MSETSDGSLSSDIRALFPSVDSNESTISSRMQRELYFDYALWDFPDQFKFCVEVEANNPTSIGTKSDSMVNSISIQDTPAIIPNQNKFTTIEDKPIFKSRENFKANDNESTNACCLCINFLIPNIIEIISCESKKTDE